MRRFDLVIIGGGVAGLVCASGAARLGARVCLVEKRSLGGDCLHSGCVPTKRLVHCAKIARLLKKADEFGIELSGAKVNFQKVMEGMRKIQSIIGERDSPGRFEGMGVSVIWGGARFLDNRTLEVNGENIYGKKFLISTGSSPFIPPIHGLKEAGALTNTSALKLEKLPQSLIILGGGPIGLEFAQIFSRLGSRVTVVEKAERILPREDKEFSLLLEDILKSEGIEIYTSTEVKKVESAGGIKKILAASPAKEMLLTAEEVLAAIGRVPNVDELNLEAAGVKYDEKGIKVGLTLQTTAKNIYACGDVTGPYAFTHMAEYQAGIALSNALFPLIKRKADYRVLPWVTYVDPELARVGLTEDEAAAQYGKKGIRVLRFNFKEVDRAVIDGEGLGLIKIICDKRLRILGAHILSARAGELIHECALAMKTNIPVTEISRMMHAYPTLSQGVKRVCDEYYREILFSGWFPRAAKWLIRMGSQLDYKK